MKFVVIDSEKFEEQLMGNPDYTKYTVKMKVNSLEELVERIKEIKPNIENVQVEIFKEDKDYGINGMVLATNRVIYIHKIE